MAIRGPNSVVFQSDFRVAKFICLKTITILIIVDPVYPKPDPLSRRSGTVLRSGQCRNDPHGRRHSGQSDPYVYQGFEQVLEAH